MAYQVAIRQSTSLILRVDEAAQYGGKGSLKPGKRAEQNRSVSGGKVRWWGRLGRKIEEKRWLEWSI